ncbi:MAG: hypothetical protein LBU09_04080 [Endomicrobium sp.]|nr:hypothetical protein [Endomicrobium sp.]
MSNVEDKKKLVIGLYGEMRLAMKLHELGWQVHRNILMKEDLPTYQIMDNQKTTLRIRNTGEVLNKGKDYNYSCFNDRFFNDWSALEIETK